MTDRISRQHWENLHSGRPVDTLKLYGIIRIYCSYHESFIAGVEAEAICRLLLEGAIAWGAGACLTTAADFPGGTPMTGDIATARCQPGSLRHGKGGRKQSKTS